MIGAVADGRRRCSSPPAPASSMPSDAAAGGAIQGGSRPMTQRRRCARAAASSPSPVAALTKTRGTRAPPTAARACRRSARGRSVVVEPVELVEDDDLRHLAGADLGEHALRPRRICSANSGLAPSTTCSSRSASAASCSVAWNASISVCGRSRMKPTVSDRRRRALDARSRWSWRVVVSRVANSWSAAYASALTRALKRVDLPALV